MTDTLTYIAATSLCLGLVIAIGLLKAQIDKRERDMRRRPREWRHGRIE